MADSCEKYSRQLIAECELEWDARCLDFFRPSAQSQYGYKAFYGRINQSISSRKRWRNYQPFIRDLATSLREYLDEDDVKLFGDHDALGYDDG
ncbi:MAG: hypothetical protein R3E67_05405 [Pseudomonadales bacterium]